LVSLALNRDALSTYDKSDRLMTITGSVTEGCPLKGLDRRSGSVII
jgi:hypothetical protein